MEATTKTHTDANHDVMVLNGVVTCMTCDRLVLDATGHRAGLVEANQTR